MNIDKIYINEMIKNITDTYGNKNLSISISKKMRKDSLCDGYDKVISDEEKGKFDHFYMADDKLMGRFYFDTPKKMYYDHKNFWELPCIHIPMKFFKETDITFL